MAVISGEETARELKQMADRLRAKPAAATHPKGWFDRFVWWLLRPLWMRVFHPFLDHQNQLHRKLVSSIISIRRDLDRLRQDHEGLSRHTVEHGQYINNLVRDKDEMHAHLSALHAPLTALIEEKQSVGEHISGLQTASEALGMELGRLTAITTELIGAKEAVEKQQAGLIEQLQNLAAEKEALTKHVTGLQAGQSSLQADIRRVSTTAEEIITAKENLEHHLAKLQDGHHLLTTDLRRTIADFISSKENLEHHLARLQNGHHLLATDLQRTTADIIGSKEDLELRQERLIDALHGLTAEKDDLVLHMAACQEGHERHAAEIGRIDHLTGALIADKEALETGQGSLIDQVRALTSEKDAVATHLGSFQDGFGHLKDEIHKTNTTVEALITHKEALETALESTHQQVASRIEALQLAYGTAETQLQELLASTTSHTEALTVVDRITAALERNQTDLAARLGADGVGSGDSS